MDETTPMPAASADHVVHLHAAGDVEAIRALFAHDAWLRARVAQGGYDGYLADLQIAWDIAAETLLRQSEVGEAPTALLDLLRYTLIWSGIHTAANTFAPGLIARAVATGLWSPERAVSAAALSWEPSRAFDVYDALQTDGKLTDAHRETIYRLMMLAAEAIEYEGMRAQAFERAAKHADPVAQTGSLAASLGAALKAADNDPYPDWYVLARLVRELPDALLDQAAAGVLTLKNSDARAWVLTILARRLPERRKALLDAALDAVPGIVDATAQGMEDVMRSNAIAQMADLLEGEQVTRAFEIGLALEGEAGSWIPRAIAPLMDRLDEEQQARALDVVLTVAEGWYRKDGLLALARYARGETRQRALEALLTITHDEARAFIRKALATDSDPALLEATIAFAEQIADAEQRTWALEMLRSVLAARAEAGAETAQDAAAERSAERTIDEQFAEALSIRWDEDRFPVLESLLPELSPDQIRIVLEDAHATRSEDTVRDRLIGKIALRAEGDVLASMFAWGAGTWQMLASCRTLLNWAGEWDEATRGAVLDYVASCLEPRLDPFTRVDLLQLLLPHLSGEVKRARSAEALATALANDYPPGRADQLSRLFNVLDETDQPAALEALSADVFSYTEFALEPDSPQHPLYAPMSTDDYAVIERLRHTFPLLNHLEGERQAHLLARVLDLTLSLQHKGYAASILAPIVPLLDADQRAATLAVVLAWDDEQAGASGLAVLRPHLTEDQVAALPEVVAVGRIGEVNRLLALARNATDAERPALLDQALAAGKQVRALGERRAAFVDLALAGVDEALEMLLESAEYMEPEDRGAFLLSLYPRLADQDETRALIWRGAITRLAQIRSGGLDSVLNWYPPWSHFEPLLTPEMRAQIPALLLEIARDWRWA